MLGEQRLKVPGGADLLWGVRESFLRYVEAVGGDVQALSPATRTSEGTMRFPRDVTATDQIQFRGGASFRAHHGALNVSFRDPRLELDRVDAETLVLSVVDTSTEISPRIIIATIDHAGRVTLAESGLALFDFQYPSGTALDPVTFSEPLPDVE